jgi:multidrug resistance efflux pump
MRKKIVQVTFSREEIDSINEILIYHGLSSVSELLRKAYYELADRTLKDYQRPNRLKPEGWRSNSRNQFTNDPVQIAIAKMAEKHNLTQRILREALPNEIKHAKERQLTTAELDLKDAIKLEALKRREIKRKYTLDD